MLASKADPLSGKEAPRQKPLESTGEGTSVSGFGDLGRIHRDGRSEHANSSACNESVNTVSMCPVLPTSTILPSDHEHSHVNSRSLQDTSDQGDDGARSNSSLTTKAVSDDHVDDGTQDSTALES